MNRMKLTMAGLCAMVLFAGSNARAHDRRDPIRAWVAAWNSHDADRVAAVFTPDAFYEDLPFGAKSHGTAEIRAFAQGFFDAVPDLGVNLLLGNLEDGHGTIEWEFFGTDKALFGTGKKFLVRGVTVIDTDKGLISRNSDYYDLAKILRDLGLKCLPF